MNRLKLTAALLTIGLSATAGAQGDTASTVTLPAPSGPYGVGARRFQWQDNARRELGAPDATGRRRLVVRLWYPAVRNGGEPEPYLPQLSTYRDSGLIGPRTSALLARVQHAARTEAAPAAGGRFPIIVFSPGNGEMEYMYTALTEDLASHGYVVLLIMHTGVSDVAFPTGRVLRRHARLYDPKPQGWEASLDPKLSINLKRALYDTMYAEAAEYLTADVSFALDRLDSLTNLPEDALRGRLDLSRIATMGHSYGGNIAVEACARDPRVKACAFLDGGAFGPVRDVGLERPFMAFRPAFENDRTPRGVAQNQLIGSMKANAHEVNIAGATHRSFMDAHFLNPATRATAIDPARVLTIVSAYARAFFGRYLAGASSTLLGARSPQFPEVYVRSLIVEFPPRER
jgi:dienelactone hydrolase